VTRKTAATFFRSDLGILVTLAAARLLFHLATNGQYGFHRDELQTLDDARHLDWGFVAYPPLTPLVARLEWALWPSLTGLRLFPAIAVCAAMVLAGRMAGELGGTRGAQILSAAAAGVAPVSLNQAALLQYVSFDYLWGVTACYLLLRLLKSGDPRWWVPVGAALGLGMETRYTMGFLALGIVCAVLLTPLRRQLRSPWLWAGAVLSLALFLPNLVWQARHRFISLEFLSYLHARDLAEGRYRGFYLEQLEIPVSFPAAPLVLLGLWFYFAREEGRRYRFLGWLFVATFALFAAAGARSYYTAPLYPMVMAGGSVLFWSWAGGLAPARRRVARALGWTAIALGGAASVLLVSPVAPAGSRLFRFTGKVHDDFREEIGWPELAGTVARVYNALAEPERARTGILTGNYGEGGALALYGPALGLPPAMSLTNSFWYRGYDRRLPDTLIVVGFDREEAQRLFQSCTVAAQNGNALGVENEESRDHPDILLCRGLRLSWPRYWESHRRFG
jgi:Dolichyl-phosphate-mannose-protein mannosyltransferase